MHASQTNYSRPVAESVYVGVCRCAPVCAGVSGMSRLISDGNDQTAAFHVRDCLIQSTSRRREPENFGNYEVVNAQKARFRVGRVVRRTDGRTK